MRDIDSIKPNIASAQWGAKAGRLAVLASILLGFAFVGPQTSTGQFRTEENHVVMTTRQAFEYAGIQYAGIAVEEWAAEADDDDLQMALDATQILEAARLAAFLSDRFGVSVTADNSPRLVAELRYYKRFRVMPPQVVRTPALQYPRGFNTLGQLELGQLELGRLDRRIGHQQVSIQ